MPSNFKLPDYLSEGDPEFPWFSDDDVAPSGFDSSRSGDKADGGEGLGDQGAENVEDVQDAAAEETEPPVI